MEQNRLIGQVPHAYHLKNTNKLTHYSHSKYKEICMKLNVILVLHLKGVCGIC